MIPYQCYARELIPTLLCLLPSQQLHLHVPIWHLAHIRLSLLARPCSLGLYLAIVQGGAPGACPPQRSPAFHTHGGARRPSFQHLVQCAYRRGKHPCCRHSRRSAIALLAFSSTRFTLRLPGGSCLRNLVVSHSCATVPPLPSQHSLGSCSKSKYQTMAMCTLWACREKGQKSPPSSSSANGVVESVQSAIFAAFRFRGRAIDTFCLMCFSAGVCALPFL